MYSCKITINNTKLKGILDFGALLKVKEDLLENGYDLTIPEIFKSISDVNNLNMHALMSILLFSISRYSDIDEEEIEDIVLSKDLDLNTFNNIFNYINLLFKKCMPQKQDESNGLFEEVEIESNDDDWDFYHMEYLWYSVLKRNDDFYKVTPKTFFNQMDTYKKINNIQSEEIDYL